MTIVPYVLSYQKKNSYIEKIKKGEYKMILYLYKSKLNQTLQKTATFSDGELRSGWCPPSHFICFH